MLEPIIISLGSNIGDRIGFIYKALALIEDHPITIRELSNVYETPSWGFESTHFYNACAILKTSLKPNALLKILLDVEDKLGRKRNSERGYQDRIIDLDLLFYKNEIIYSKDLKIPHPKLHLRNFILKPLLDIAPKFKHPVLRITITELNYHQLDKIKIVQANIDLSLPPIFKSFPFISIEGNIGVGKTTLAKMISKKYNIKFYSEDYNSNPYLENFYKDPSMHALSTETFFLNNRFENDKIFWKQNNDKVVADFCFFKCLVFAKQNLKNNDYETFKKDFDNKMDKIKIPSLVVLITKNFEELEQQIKKRDRSFEREIKLSYLKKLEKGYHLIIKNFEFPILEYPLDNIDFNKNQFEFEKILRAIFRASF
tara:strand:- start:4799 stop:5908 length:1110 start_codon:yes stop_codon:yes gene_type:complete